MSLWSEGKILDFRMGELGLNPGRYIAYRLSIECRYMRLIYYVLMRSYYDLMLLLCPDDEMNTQETIPTETSWPCTSELHCHETVPSAVFNQSVRTTMERSQVPRTFVCVILKPSVLFCLLTFLTNKVFNQSSPSAKVRQGVIKNWKQSLGIWLWSLMMSGTSAEAPGISGHHQPTAVLLLQKNNKE